MQAFVVFPCICSEGTKLEVAPLICRQKAKGSCTLVTAVKGNPFPNNNTLASRGGRQSSL